MASFQGLGLSDQPIERERLDYASYFTSMVLAVYDNILGPTILKVWVAKQPVNISDPGKIQIIINMSGYSTGSVLAISV